MIEKTRESSGADERTPSIPQYFSWINNTNEGSTEAQTLTNLDYFKWLHDTYGMELVIYAWDAGNLDGASGTYEHPETSPKLLKQYPHGYRPLAEAAAKFGCHLGVWGGADGFGDTPEEQEKRYELIVSLCRDLGFMEFKFDTVCGFLREEKRAVFKSMIDECRKYVPGLIVLNHRNDLGEAEICATTFLWGGMETYIDVFMLNDVTGSHHRVGTLTRGLVPEMKRLTEDHGVCISSCLDYFEDDLILQGFARSLILAPEIYGNPWLLRDSEQAHLAHIYNLHRRYRDILVNGMELPAQYGKFAVSRGSGDTRLLVFSNPTWQKQTIPVRISEEIGLNKASRFVVKSLHPYESLIAAANWNDTVNVEVEPFRAALVLVEEYDRFCREDFVLTGCAYESVDGSDGLTKTARIFKSDGAISALGCRAVTAETAVGDNTVRAPHFHGRMMGCLVPHNAEQLYEATCFNADCDCLEAQSRKRSGETAIPAVQAARDAFFGQATYKARGTESAWIFDGCDDTYFDGESVYYGTRLNGGCLRVDFGKVYDAKTLEIVFFDIDEPIHEVRRPNVAPAGESSTDLSDWNRCELYETLPLDRVTAPVVRHRVHNIEYFPGTRRVARYTLESPVRYFRLPSPMDRIYHIRLLDGQGRVIPLENPRANNMLSPYAAKRFTRAKTVTIHVPKEVPSGAYLALAINGEHGAEGVYCAAECGGKPFGCTDRAASYPMNNWEHIVGASPKNYTYYLHITPELLGQEVAVYALFTGNADANCEVWMCDGLEKEALGEVTIRN